MFCREIKSRFLVTKFGGKADPEELFRKRQQRIVRTSLAGPMKRHIGQGIFGLTYQQMNDPELKETPLKEWWNLTPRQILQRVGTEGLRAAIHPDIWAEVCARQASRDRALVIDDIRFPNEIEVLRRRGRELDVPVWIIEVNRSDRMKEQYVDSHPSETALIGYQGWDLRVENDGTPSGLAGVARELSQMVLAAIR
ncbi:MAG: hypothetical protein D6812_06570 [Deltaproteobacteria bacterium]|nr:MAG: hypothetical protein D6812_06570 [Deltaproteobacteria bacterium]